MSDIKLTYYTKMNWSSYICIHNFTIAMHRIGLLNSHDRKHLCAEAHCRMPASGTKDSGDF